jgi:hypothetical protein
MRRLFATPLLFALLAAGPEAAGQSPPPQSDVTLQPSVAAALLEEGKRLLEAGRVTEAKAKLEASIRNDPSPAALLALGTCHERLGSFASAWRLYQRARRLGDRAAAEEASNRASAIEPKLPKLKVVVVVAPGWPLPSVLLDGTQEIEKESWGTPVPLDPGSHTLEAVAPGKRSFSTLFEVRQEGEIKTVLVPDLTPLPKSRGVPSPKPAPLPPPDLPKATMIAIMTLVGVAAVHGSVGAALVYKGQGREQMAGAILLGDAGAAALAALITWGVGRHRTQPIAVSRSWQLAPFIAREAGGLVLKGAF